MKKEVKNLIRIMVIVLFILITFSGFVHADAIIGSTDAYDFTKASTGVDNPMSIKAIGRILGVIRIFGTIVSVAALAIIGIKYMVGSTEEKASYKKTLLPYLVGAIILFAGTNLLQGVYDAVMNAKGSVTPLPANMAPYSQNYIDQLQMQNEYNEYRNRTSGYNSINPIYDSIQNSLDSPWHDWQQQQMFNQMGI